METSVHSASSTVAFSRAAEEPLALVDATHPLILDRFDLSFSDLDRRPNQMTFNFSALGKTSSAQHDEYPSGPIRIHMQCAGELRVRYLTLAQQGLVATSQDRTTLWYDRTEDLRFGLAVPHRKFPLWYSQSEINCQRPATRWHQGRVRMRASATDNLREVHDGHHPLRARSSNTHTSSPSSRSHGTR